MIADHRGSNTKIFSQHRFCWYIAIEPDVVLFSYRSIKKRATSTSNSTPFQESPQILPMGAVRPVVDRPGAWLSPISIPSHLSSRPTWIPSISPSSLVLLAILDNLWTRPRLATCPGNKTFLQTRNLSTPHCPLTTALCTFSLQNISRLISKDHC